MSVAAEPTETQVVGTPEALQPASRSPYGALASGLVLLYFFTPATGATPAVISFKKNEYAPVPTVGPVTMTPFASVMKRSLLARSTVPVTVIATVEPAVGVRPVATPAEVAGTERAMVLKPSARIEN
jgi:hypothetical protein